MPMDEVDLDLLLGALSAVGDASSAIADVIAVDKSIGGAPDQETFNAALDRLKRARRTLRESAKFLLEAADVAERARTAAISKSQPP